METFVARAFLNKLLNESERWELKEYEKTLPPGRLLTGFEICRRYKLEPKPIPDKDLQQMEMLYWKWKQRWEAQYLALEAKRVGNEPFNVNGDEFDGDLRDWEKFSDDNYTEALPTLSAMTCLVVSLIPFMAVMARG